MRKQKKVLVFIDGPNLNAMQSSIGFQVDHAKVRDFLIGDMESVGVRYYATKYTSDKAPGFLTRLKSFGYEVLITDKDNTDVDQDVVEDIQKMFDKADVVVLVSGDHIFYEPLKSVKDAKKKIKVFCAKEMLSEPLRELADQVIDPADHKEELIDMKRTTRFETKQSTREKAAKIPIEIITPVASLFALGKKVTVSQTSNEIVIRITIKKGHESE